MLTDVAQSGVKTAMREKFNSKYGDRWKVSSVMLIAALLSPTECKYVRDRVDDEMYESLVDAAACDMDLLQKTAKERREAAERADTEADDAVQEVPANDAAPSSPMPLMERPAADGTIAFDQLLMDLRRVFDFFMAHDAALQASKKAFKPGDDGRPFTLQWWFV